MLGSTLCLSFILLSNQIECINFTNSSYANYFSSAFLLLYQDFSPEVNRICQFQFVSSLGLHDIGKNWHCDILFFHDIYCDIKTISPDDLNSSI